jgi:hypothetical protein
MPDDSTPAALREATLVFAVLVFVHVVTLPSAVPYHVDTVRDLLIARELAHGPTWDAIGSQSSALFFHGVAWPMFLSLFARVGAAPGSVLATLVVLQSASAAAVFHVLRRAGTSRAVALIVLCATLHFAARTEALVPLWNPSLVPSLVNVLIVLCFLAPRPGGKGLAARFGAVFLVGVGSQVHLEFFFFLPAVFLLPGRRKERWVLALTALPIVLSTWAVLSPDALKANASTVVLVLAGKGAAAMPPEMGVMTLPGYVWLAAAAAIATAFFRRREQAGAERRSWYPSVVAFGASYLLCYVASWLGHAADRRYVEPLIPIACVVIAPLLCELEARFGRGVRIAALVFGAIELVALVPRHWDTLKHPSLSLRDIHHAVVSAEGVGLDVHRVYGSVSGGQTFYREFLSGLWLDAPCARATRTMGEEVNSPRFLMLVAPPGTAPVVPGWKGRSFQSEGPHHVMWFGEYDPYVLVTAGRACGARDSPSEDCRPLPLSFPNAGFDRRCWEANWGHDAVGARIGGQAATAIEYPVRIPAHGRRRTVHLGIANRTWAEESPCRPAIVSVRGVAWQQGGKPWQGELLPSAEEQTGVLRAAWPWHDRRCFAESALQYPVPVLEIDSELFPHVARLLD